MFGKKSNICAEYKSPFILICLMLLNDKLVDFLDWKYLKSKQENVFILVKLMLEGGFQNKLEFAPIALTVN
jgi:hypothetical protein